MSVTVLLDAGPLGMVTNPRATQQTFECTQWLKGLLLQGYRVAIPEISDYEVRRELMRAGKAAGLARLDALKANMVYLPLNTEIMLKAAEYWSEARKRGQPTAGDAAIDGDVILSAQAWYTVQNGNKVIVATTNVKHLDQFIDAREWQAV